MDFRQKWKATRNVRHTEAHIRSKAWIKGLDLTHPDVWKSKENIRLPHSMLVKVTEHFRQGKTETLGPRRKWLTKRSRTSEKAVLRAHKPKKKRGRRLATSPPLINWPRLFHAVVSLWCRHVCWLGEKIFMELGHKPERRQGRGRGTGTGKGTRTRSPREREAGEFFQCQIYEVRKSPTTLTAQVTWQPALI